MAERAVFYHAEHADPAALAGGRVAVVGYGNLGSSMAALLADAGLSVTVGNIEDGYRTRAERDGFAVTGIGEACAGAVLVYVLIPDEAIPAVFAQSIGPALGPGSAVCFASGYCLAFGLVDVPAGVDVLLLAPRMLGEEVLKAVRAGDGYVSYVSVERDATGKAEARLLALALAVGSLRRGALRLPAAQEALLDLLVEQTVGPYLGIALQLAFALGTEAGLPPEAMVLELYGSGEMSRVFRAFAEEGFFRSVNGHGAVAAYGGFLRTLELDSDAMRQHFRAVLEDIRSGGFARRLQEEEAGGYPTLRAIERLTGGGDEISSAEERVREALGRP
ncbi:MAG: NAD(P)-binding domain-containing protein [Acidimicrobiales bacterium]